MPKNILFVRKLLFLFLLLSINKAIAQPLITSFSPASGPVGTSVTITGNFFDATAANNFVYFGAARATVTGHTLTTLTVIAPAGATFQPLTVLNTSSHLTASASSPFLYTFGNPFGTGIPANFYRPKTDFATAALPYFSAIADLDRDGKLDIVVANANSTFITVYRNTSSAGTVDASSFGDPVNFTAGYVLSTVLFADIDGDGRLDIVVSNLGTNYFSVLRNTAVPGTINASSFQPAVNFPIYAQASPYSLAAGDVDGDGRPDIAVANSQGNTVSVFRNTATAGTINASSFGAGVNIPTGTYPRFVTINDIDGDGKPELVVLNENSNSISVFRNTAVAGSITETSFGSRTDFATGNNPYTMATGDLDGDGKADIVVSNHDSYTLSVLRNTSVTGSIPATSLAPKVDFVTGAEPYMTIIADADGDSKPDLLSVNSTASTLSVLRNVSAAGMITSSSFAGKVDFTTGAYPISLTAGDVDGDGFTEVLTANAGKSTLTIFQLNTMQPLAGQSLAAIPGSTGSGPELAGKEMQLYPNPTSGEFTVQLPGINHAAGSMEILNESGTMIEKRQLNFDGKAALFTKKISLRNRPAGVYYIKVITTKGVQMLKVLVQR